MSSLEANKKHSDNSSSKYKADSGGNASHSNDDDNNEINVNKSNMISIPDPEYMDLRIKQLTGAVSEESPVDSGVENQSDS